MKHLKWFIAGALAVPLFHQTALLLLNAVGFIDRPVFSFEPTKPFGVPQVISLAFWGGVWGIILGAILDRVRSKRAFWITACLFGAIAPTLVAAFVVAPLKGVSMGGNPRLAVMGLLINAAWGCGTACVYRVLDRGRSAPASG